MSVINYGDDYHYAHTRLSGCIVGTMDGSFVKVNEVRPGGVDCFDLFFQDHTVLKLEDLNLESPSMGYVNTPKGLAYASRIPKRYWKQGLNENNVKIRGVRFPLYASYFAESLKRQFPSVDEAAELIVNREEESLAFSQKFCLKAYKPDTLGLFYKTTDVGRAVLGKNNQFVNLQLDKKFSFLQEVLESEVNV